MTVTQNISAKTETTVTVRWASDPAASFLWYSTDGGATYTDVGEVSGTSGTFIIGGLTENTVYSVKTKIRDTGGTAGESEAAEVTTYRFPYATVTPDFTIGELLSITIYNPIGRGVSVRVRGIDGSFVASVTTSGTEVSGFNTDAAVSRLYGSIPAATSGVYLVDVTYNDMVSTVNGGTYSVNPAVCSPLVGTFSYYDVNFETVQLTGNNRDIVRSHSFVQFEASGLAGQKSASIASCRVAVNGEVYPLSVSGSAASGGSATINSQTDVTAVLTVTDSRGLTVTKLVTLSMLDWFVPTAVISAGRAGNFGSSVDLTVYAGYAPINGNNAVSITYEATKQGDVSPSVSGTLSDGVTDTVTLDNGFEWAVAVTLTDLLNGTATYTVYVPKGMPVVFLDKDRGSVGINCFPKDSGTVEIGGVSAIRSIMTRSLSADLSNPTASSETVVPLDLSLSSGGKLTVTNDGGIKIGANVTKIAVSGEIFYKTVSAAGYRKAVIVKNSFSSANTLAFSCLYFTSGHQGTVAIPPRLVSVQENDVIYLLYYTGSASDAVGGNAYDGQTSLTVQTIE